MPRHPQWDDGGRPTFAVTFPARVDALPSQRHGFTGWLRAMGVHGDVADDLHVVFSELTTNAVHGSPDDAALVDVRAAYQDGEVVLDVRNTTETDGYGARRWDLDDALREGGRGLLIVQALVDELDVRRAGRDLAVRCRVELA